MATLVLRQPVLWNPRTGGLLPLLLPNADNRDLLWELDGEVLRTANGGSRVVTVGGVRAGAEQDVWVDAAGLATLREWAGEVVLYRDGLGSHVWGVYLSASAAPSLDGRHFTVPLAVERVTWEEFA